jgi:hypothetical protein
LTNVRLDLAWTVEKPSYVRIGGDTAETPETAFPAFDSRLGDDAPTEMGKLVLNSGSAWL